MNIFARSKTDEKKMNVKLHIQPALSGIRLLLARDKCEALDNLSIVFELAGSIPHPPASRSDITFKLTWRAYPRPACMLTSLSDKWLVHLEFLPVSLSLRLYFTINYFYYLLFFPLRINGAFMREYVIIEVFKSIYINLKPRALAAALVRMYLWAQKCDNKLLFYHVSEH